jgi:peptidoglycan/LPS O-acetylase OafA/YrhL
MTEHVKNLHALRGAAALLVVLYHVSVLEDIFGLHTFLVRELQWFGFVGVDVFFALSGFLITATNRKHLGTPSAVPRYLFRRFWRVYPPFWAVMGLSFLTLWALFGSGFVGPEIRRYWVGWAALLPMPIPNPMCGPAWTLCYEVLFYLAFGLLMIGPPRLAAAALCGWAAVIVYRMPAPTPTNVYVQMVTSPFILEFLGGCLVAWLAGRGVRRGWRAALVLAPVYLATGVWLSSEPGVAYKVTTCNEPVRVLVFGPPAVLLVYALVAADGRWPRRLPNWLMKAGDASYSIYLLHGTVMVAGMVVGYHIPHNNLPHLLWLATTFTVAVGGGLLFHRWVERPLLGLRKRRLPRVPGWKVLFRRRTPVG